MSQIQNLRSYILEELDRHDEVSLTDVIAKFDFYQHAIPTLNEIRRAIEGAGTIGVIKKDNMVFLNHKKDETSVQIEEADIQSSYGAYIKLMRKRN
jgi:hypothetical protein